MTKQDKIREGIEARIRLGIIDTTYKTADDIVAFLDENGLVIKTNYTDPATVEPLILPKGVKSYDRENRDKQTAT